MRPRSEIPQDQQFHEQPSPGEENLGLKNLSALRSLCRELSRDEPSPGGGTAAAASGAMAASLLVMVCEITAKSKKHAADRKRLIVLSRSLTSARDELIALARDDARAYDLVLVAVRRARKSGKRDSSEVRRALTYAAKVPMKTANLCIDVLGSAVEVAQKGISSASSDVGVAVLLAHAGYGGAAMNVRINLEGLQSSPFAEVVSRELLLMDNRADELMGKGLRALRSRTK